MFTFRPELADDDQNEEDEEAYDLTRFGGEEDSTQVRYPRCFLCDVNPRWGLIFGMHCGLLHRCYLFTKQPTCIAVEHFCRGGFFRTKLIRHNWNRTKTFYKMQLVVQKKASIKQQNKTGILSPMQLEDKKHYPSNTCWVLVYQTQFWKLVRNTFFGNLFYSFDSSRGKKWKSENFSLKGVSRVGFCLGGPFFPLRQMVPVKAYPH